jgi:hypothetical protein
MLSIILLFSLLTRQGLALDCRMYKSNLYLRSLTRVRLFSGLSAETHPERSKYLEAATRLWVERFVFGQGMCPFAGAVLGDNKMKMRTLYGDGEETSIVQLSDEIIKEAKLLSCDDADPSTTLIVVPDFKDFHEFLELVDIVEGLFEIDGIDEQVQLATFHPDYMFADSIDKNDVDNYTNRSPFPVLHLLRVSEVSDAIESYNIDGRDTSIIWQKNKETMKMMGISKIKDITAKILVDAKKEVDRA